jgi:hypothetical protein
MSSDDSLLTFSFQYRNGRFCRIGDGDLSAKMCHRLIIQERTQLRQRLNGSEFLQSADGADSHIRTLVMQRFDQWAERSLVTDLSQRPSDVVIDFLIPHIS